MITKLLPDLITGIWAIKPEAAEGYLPLIVSFIKNPAGFNSVDYSDSRRQHAEITAVNNANKALSFFEVINDEGKISVPQNSIVRLNLLGTITKYNQFCGPVGMITQTERLRMLDSNENVAAILLYIDSPGGEGYAARMMADAVKRSNTPVIAFVSDLAASAAYMIASACDEIYANSEIAEIGSIGTYINVVDFRQQLENEGIRLHEIYASASIDKNRPYKEAISGNYEPIRQFANTFNDTFLRVVKEGRQGKLASQDDVWGTGKIFMAEQALDIGLIDGILDYEDTLETIFENLI